MEFNSLSSLYNEVKEIFEHDRRYFEKKDVLSLYLFEKYHALASDLSFHPEHALLYRNIKSLADKKIDHRVKKIEIRAEILRSPLNEDLKKKIDTKNPQELIELRRQIKGQFKPAVDRELLLGIAELLDLNGKSLEEARLVIKANFSDKQEKAEAYAAWIDLNQYPLAGLGFSSRDLAAIAPFLRYADLKGLEDPLPFITLCSNALHMKVSSDKIKELKELPPHLEELECSNCTQLTLLSLNKAPRLQTLDCNSCYSMITLELLDVPQLRLLNCHGCNRLTSLSAPHTPELVFYHGTGNSALTTLSLPYTPQLREVTSMDCENLQTVRLPYAPLLEKIDCYNCRRLETIESEGLPSCRLLDLNDSYSFRSYPQVPSTATVHCPSSNSFISFRVDPRTLEQHPLKVLLDLGQYLLSDRHFPNVIWWDPETNQPAKGIDAGGLRRQLVTTLCQNLFKSGSQFPFTEGKPLSQEENRSWLSTLTRLSTLRRALDRIFNHPWYQESMQGAFTGKLPLLNDSNDTNGVYALRTLARLIALSSTSTLLLGEDIPHSFFFAIHAILDDQTYDFTDELLNKIYLNLTGLWDFDLPAQENFSNNRAALLNPERKSLALPVAIVAKELKNIRSFSLNTFRNNPLQFIESVKGTAVTKEEFMAHLQCEGQMREYFEKYIEEHPHKLCDLAELFTSCRTLGNRQIAVYVRQGRDVGSLPLIHTCSQEVEMPPYPAYEQFREKLDLAFSTLKTFENA